MSRPLLVLDVDGVMIEPGRSFKEAVARSLKELVPRQAWDDDHFLAFKRVGGFNNDFRLVAAALALAERGEMERVWTSEGVGFPDLETRIQVLEPRCTKVVQRHYSETRVMEKAQITSAELGSLGVPVAIFTGRPPEELSMAVDILGFELPTVCDSAPHLRKPRPDGLLQLADEHGAREVVFVGDTRDDATCLREARFLRPDVTWTFAAVGPERDRIAAEGDLKGETLRSLLPELRKRL